MSSFPSEWNKLSLREATIFLKDGTHFSPKSTTGPFRYLTSKNIRTGRMDLANCHYISAEDHARIYSSCPVEIGDVLLTKDGAAVGNVCRNTLSEPFSLLSSVAVLRGNPSVLDNEFLLQFLMSPIGQSSVLNEVAGQAITRITMTTLASLQIAFPPLSEQRAISSLLAAWDRGISQLSNLIAAKIDVREGLVQRLLSGGLRFKQYKNSVHELVALNSVLSKVSDSVVPSRNEMYREIGVRSHGKGIFHKEPVTGGALGNKRVYRVVPGCLTLNIVFAWERAVAITTDREKGMIASHRFPMFRPIPDRLLCEYALLFLLSKVGSQALELASPGGAGRNRTLSQTSFLKNRIPLPSLSEQHRVVSLVQAADREIELLRKQLELLKLQKKGLMQKLLTGQVRVKLPKGAK
jgi:restriction endonuclease S subunit